MKTHYGRPTKQPIEALKNQWAAVGVSPKEFYLRFYQHRSHQTYLEFLEMINFHERYSPTLAKAVEDFQKS